MNHLPHHFHVGFILDGNRRYAKKHGITHGQAMSIAVDRVFELYDSCLDHHIKAATFYMMSADNFKRPEVEQKTIFKALDHYANRMLCEVDTYGICIRIIGKHEGLPKKLREKLEHLEEVTKNNQALVNFLAIGYSGQGDILKAVNQLHRQLGPEEEIGVSLLEKHLSTAPCAKVDFIIRTGGDKRLSDFLLWQAPYAELYFTR